MNNRMMLLLVWIGVLVVFLGLVIAINRVNQKHEDLVRALLNGFESAEAAQQSVLFQAGYCNPELDCVLMTKYDTDVVEVRHQKGPLDIQNDGIFLMTPDEAALFHEEANLLKQGGGR